MSKSTKFSVDELLKHSHEKPLGLLNTSSSNDELKLYQEQQHNLNLMKHYYFKFISEKNQQLLENTQRYSLSATPNKDTRIEPEMHATNDETERDHHDTKNNNNEPSDQDLERGDADDDLDDHDDLDDDPDCLNTDSETDYLDYDSHSLNCKHAIITRHFAIYIFYLNN